MKFFKCLVFISCLIFFDASYAYEIEVSGQVVIEKSPCGASKKDQGQKSECAFPLDRLEGLKVEFVLDSSIENPHDGEKIFYATINKIGQFKTSLSSGTFFVRLDRAVSFAHSEMLTIYLKEDELNRKDITLKIGILLP
jgi:hypothetical protein